MAIKNIYPELTSFHALRTAYKEVAAGKSDKEDCLRFECELEDNLHELSCDLRQGLVPKVHYKSFYVYVPKLRKVIYIDFTSKIIQRAIYDFINPRLAKTFIKDTYACIPGRGQLKAMLRVKQWMEETRTRPGDWYYYKFDVAKFFYRIDHDILMHRIEDRIADRQATDLIGYYVCDSGRPFGIPVCMNQQDVTEADMLFDVGIPIGGGLSHTLGNLYLDTLDQYATRTLGCRRYIRYMDDILIFDNSKARLVERGKRMDEFVQDKLRLEFNQKTVLRPVRCGVEFVGCRIYDDHVMLRKSTTLHMKRRLKGVMEDYNQGLITLQKAEETVASYKAMLKHVDSKQLDQKLWSWFVLMKGDLKDALQHPDYGVFI